MRDFSPGVSGAIRNDDARAAREGIRILADARFLFDTYKYEIKPSGKTSVGNIEDDQALSGNRARSVGDLLKSRAPRKTGYPSPPRTAHVRTKGVPCYNAGTDGEPVRAHSTMPEINP